MRQSNQNKRLRSRNRKGPSPLTKSFESNGPDGKIRGTAISIAEKYTQASRDASAAGDRVKAENLMQHAEHYNRIVAAAQAQLQPPPSRDHDNRSDSDYGDDDGREYGASQSVSDPDTPQPTVDHSSQLANGVANGKIPNGVKVEDRGADGNRGAPIETDRDSDDEDGDGNSGRRRGRGRGRPPRRPMQPSAIAAEVAGKSGDQPRSDSDGADGAD